MMNNPLKSLFNKSKIKNTESFFIYACMARSKDLYSTTAEFPFSVNSNICLVLLCVISMF